MARINALPKPACPGHPCKQSLLPLMPDRGRRSLESFLGSLHLVRRRADGLRPVLRRIVQELRVSLRLLLGDT